MPLKINNDKGEDKLLEFKWVKSEELLNVDLRPENIKKLLVNGEYNNKLIHLVERD